MCAEWPLAAGPSDRQAAFPSRAMHVCLSVRTCSTSPTSLSSEKRPRSPAPTTSTPKRPAARRAWNWRRGNAANLGETDRRDARCNRDQHALRTVAPHRPPFIVLRCLLRARPDVPPPFVQVCEARTLGKHPDPQSRWRSEQTPEQTRSEAVHAQRRYRYR